MEVRSETPGVPSAAKRRSSATEPTPASAFARSTAAGSAGDPRAPGGPSTAAREQRPKLRWQLSGDLLEFVVADRLGGRLDPRAAVQTRLGARDALALGDRDQPLLERQPVRRRARLVGLAAL